MNAPQHRDMTHDELQVFLQRYVDGELSGPDATKLFLAAQQDPDLQAEIEDYRALFAGLDDLPREEPAVDFDGFVLGRVPYDRYASAPRKQLPVLVFGKALPSPLSRVLRSLGRGGAAVMAAYLLFLVTSHSFLAEGVSALSLRLSGALDALSRSVSEIPLLSGLVGSLAWAYDAIASAVAALGRAWGEGVVTFVLGLALGVLVFAAVKATRRRHEAHGTHA